MAFTLNFGTSEQSYTEKIHQLANLSISTDELQHWSLSEDTDILAFIDAYNSDIIAIYRENGAVDSFDESGNYIRTYTSEDQHNAAEAEVTAYKANVSANIAHTTEYGPVVLSVTFPEYLERFKSNVAFSLAD